MRQFFKKPWFLKTIILAVVCELIVGAWQRFVYFWAKDYGPNTPADFNPPSFFVSWWTLRRPFVFLVFWALLFFLFDLRLKGKKTNLPIAGVWIAMLSCYAISWYDIVGSIEAYLQQPPVRKPFMGNLFGFNEWDAVRLILIIILFCYWLYRLKWKPGRNASARLAVN